MIDQVDFRLPRLFVDHQFAIGSELVLDDRVAHYLKNVLRRQTGDEIRLFNGKNGEVLGRITECSKKNVRVEVVATTRAQPDIVGRVHLIFAPLKKPRQDMMLEKAVELGVDALHPVLTDHGEIRDLNMERAGLQMIEASEQSERLSIPVMHPLQSLRDVMVTWPENCPIIAGVERVDAKPLAAFDDVIALSKDIAVFIGPVGGLSDGEKLWLQKIPVIHPVSLGVEILRSETAALAMLSYVKMRRIK
jgi:16S rRNA (uracil1498-N3)-methyltransferase